MSAVWYLSTITLASLAALFGSPSRFEPIFLIHPCISRRQTLCRLVKAECPAATTATLQENALCGLEAFEKKSELH